MSVIFENQHLSECNFRKSTPWVWFRKTTLWWIYFRKTDTLMVFARHWFSKITWFSKTEELIFTNASYLFSKISPRRWFRNTHLPDWKVYTKSCRFGMISKTNPVLIFGWTRPKIMYICSQISRGKVLKTKNFAPAARDFVQNRSNFLQDPGSDLFKWPFRFQMSARWKSWLFCHPTDGGRRLLFWVTQP